MAGIGRFCQEQGIDAWFRPDGDLGAASSEGADRVLGRQRDGGGPVGRTRSLPRGGSRQRPRTDRHSPPARRHLHLRWARRCNPRVWHAGIRRALLERGVRIYEQSPVTRFGAGTPAVAETPGGTVRAGVAIVALNAWAARLEAVPAAAHRPWQLHRAHGAGPGEARGDPVDQRHGPVGPPGCAPLRPHDARRPDRVRRRRDAAGAGAPDRTAILLGRTRGAHRRRGSLPDVPVVRRRADRSGMGRTDRRGRPPPAVLRLPRTGERALRARATRGTASGPPIWADRSSRRWRSGRTSELLRLPLVTERPLRFPPEPILSPGAQVVNQAIRRKDPARGPGGGAEPDRGLRRAPSAPDGIQPGSMTPDGVIVRSTSRSRTGRRAASSTSP